MYNAGPNIPFSTNVNFSNVQLEAPSTQLSNNTPLVAPDHGRQHYRLGQDPEQTAGQLPVQHWRAACALRQDGVGTVQYVGNQNRHQNAYRENESANDPRHHHMRCSRTTILTTTRESRILGSTPSGSRRTCRTRTTTASRHRSTARSGATCTLQAAYTLSRAIRSSHQQQWRRRPEQCIKSLQLHYDNGPSGLDRTHIAFRQLHLRHPHSQRQLQQAAEVDGRRMAGVGYRHSANVWRTAQYH